MQENLSVLIVNQNIDAVGILVNAAFVLGLTAGHSLDDETYGCNVVDGDGRQHLFLTRIGHYVRKASPNKLRSLRNTLAEIPGITLVDYTEDAAPADYEMYASALGNHRGDEISYRAIYVYGPTETVLPLTKNLSRL